MNAKKILFKISGILKCVASGFVIFLFGFSLILSMSQLCKSTFMENIESLNEIIEQLAASDPQYAELASVPIEEALESIFRIFRVFSIVMLLIGACGVALGVFNLIFSHKYESMLMGRKGRKALFTVLSLLLYPGLITNILTIIALFLKDKNVEVDEQLKEGE